jgi:hypothetical protein
MTTEQYVAELYSDDNYSTFLCESALLFTKDLITEEELRRRRDAVKAQIEKQ